MKKLRILATILLTSLLAGCEFKNTIGLLKKTELTFEEGQNLDETHKKGKLGEFELLAPATNSIVTEEPTFSWTPSENAITYTLEVCSIESFEYVSSTVVYAKETNIAATSYKLTSSLRQKNITYYWRVTAVNDYNTKTIGRELVSDVSTFFYETQNVGEIEIGVGEAEDWSLHKQGSVADISIDHNDFFGTGDQDSLNITFEKENTLEGQDGVENSRGWIVVQKAVEKDFYGTDAFYCNFYYMGHDSTILIRIIDQDGELWYKQVKFSQNVRQAVLLKFEDFVLRTRDTVVMNQEFNYEHIQAIEVCFEQTFGDGCCIVGGIKCVNYADYAELFVSKLNFNMIPTEEWITESYDFKETVSEDGSELLLEYSKDSGFNGNASGMGSYGYGFSKIPFKRYFADGNAIKVKIKYSGTSSNVRAIIRLYEPDGDRWAFVYPYSKLKTDEFTEFTIPYMAFDQSNMSEGKRQFYYIENIQFGLDRCYGSGSIIYKDFEIVTLPSVSENPRVVGEDGIIEDFDSYTDRIYAYENWETSFSNKDEGIFLVDEDKFNNGTNVLSGQFNYKSDMAMATYDIYTDVKVEGLNAIKFWIKDRSSKSDDGKFSSLTDDDVAPTFDVEISLNDGRTYRYVIDKAPRKWTEYIIPFTEFTIIEGIESEASKPLESQNVINFKIGMQYFYYYTYQGNQIAYPVYKQNNPVLVDTIMFANSNELNITQLEKEVHMDENGVTKVDDFEYATQEELDLYWFKQSNLDYENIALSDEVSSEGGNHSVKLDYKGSTSVSYVSYPLVGRDVQCKAISLDVKGDNVCALYINLYVRNGDSIVQHRYIINNPTTDWTRYVIGFNNFNGSPGLGAKSLQDLQRISFGIVNTASSELSSINIDNIELHLNGVKYDTYSTTKLS